MLKENNVRTGFFEPEQYEAVRGAPARRVQPVVTFAYITGWRVESEVLPLQWRQVDFDGRHGAARRGHDEERRRPRVPDDGRAAGAPRGAARRHRRGEEGRAASSRTCSAASWPGPRRRQAAAADRRFDKAWTTACRAAGLPGPHPARLPPHRRAQPGARRHPRARRDADDRAQDALVFERYNIVSDGDLRDAARRLDAQVASAGRR